MGENASNLNHSVPESEVNLQNKGSTSGVSNKEEKEKKDVTVSTATLVPGPKPLVLNIDLPSQQNVAIGGNGKVVVPTQPSSPPQPPQMSLPNSPPQQPFEVTQVSN